MPKNWNAQLALHLSHPVAALAQVGVTAMLVASKYEEIWAPEVKDFVFISDEAYTREQILEMEKIMLNTLRFNLTVPTAFAFLHRYLKAGAVPKATQVRCCQRLTQYTSHFCSCVAFRAPQSICTYSHSGRFRLPATLCM